MNDLILTLEDGNELTLAMGEAEEMELTLEQASGYPAYPGPYTVTPILHDEQILETNGMLMTDNVTVKEIPVVYTSNPYDGKTVVIG